jgi:hypothetical protein
MNLCFLSGSGKRKRGDLIPRLGKTHSSLTSVLKTKCTNYQPKKAATFSRNDVCKFLLDAADQEWILQKVALMMGILGGCRCDELCKMMNSYSYSSLSTTRRHGNFAGVHTLLRIILSSNSAVLINIITGVSPPHFDFFVFYVLCQC